MNQAKAIRKLGALTCVQLQAKKTSNVEVIASEGIDKDLLGVFYNSFVLSNYEFSTKTNPAALKHIASFELSHAHLDQVKESDEYKLQVACAEATVFSRDLSNTRGSEANPAYVEAHILKFLEEKKDPNIAEVRVLRAKEL